MAKRVVLIVADGLRPDAIDRVGTPHIDRLRTAGAWSWQARTVQPSGTLTCHASMFLAVPYAIHGVKDETWPSPRGPIPGITDVAHDARLPVELFYSWLPLRQLNDGEGSHARHHYQTIVVEADDLDLAKDAAAPIATGRAALTFVYLQSPDVVGHDHGWMSERYLACVETVDRAVGTVVDAAWADGHEDDTAILFLADHGGIGTGHGEDVPEVMTIPWIVSGPGARRGHEVQAPVSIMDTAPTIARLLGLPIPEVWQGRVVDEALYDDTGGR